MLDRFNHFNAETLFFPSQNPYPMKKRFPDTFQPDTSFCELMIVMLVEQEVGDDLGVCVLNLLHKVGTQSRKLISLNLVPAGFLQVEMQGI